MSDDPFLAELRSTVESTHLTAAVFGCTCSYQDLTSDEGFITQMRVTDNTCTTHRERPQPGLDAWHKQLELDNPIVAHEVFLRIQALDEKEKRAVEQAKTEAWQAMEAKVAATHREIAARDAEAAHCRQVEEWRAAWQSQSYARDSA